MDIFVKYMSIGLGILICALVIAIGIIGLDGIRNWLACKRVIKALSPIAELSRVVRSHEFSENSSWAIRYTWSDGHCIILVGSSLGFNIHSYEADQTVSNFSNEYNMLLAAARNLQDRIDSEN